MPRNVRNFWMDAYVDGRKTNISGGPVGKYGEMVVAIKIRENGCISDQVVEIHCRVDGDKLSIIAEQDAKRNGCFFELARTTR